MRNKKAQGWIGFVLIVSVSAMISLFIGMIVQEFYNINNYSIEKGDCFDKEGNKINEVTCDVKVPSEEYKEVWVYATIPTFLILVVLFTIIFMKMGGMI